jgi:hypothetical protein
MTRLTPIIRFPKQNISSWFCNLVMPHTKASNIDILCWCKVVVSQDNPVVVTRLMYDSDEFIKHNYGIVMLLLVTQERFTCYMYLQHIKAPLKVFIS